MVPPSPSRNKAQDDSFHRPGDRNLANGHVSGISKPCGEVRFGPKDDFLTQIQKAAASSNFLPEESTAIATAFFAKEGPEVPSKVAQARVGCLSKICVLTLSPHYESNKKLDDLPASSGQSAGSSSLTEISGHGFPSLF